MQDRGVQGAPGGGAVRGDRAGQEVRVGAVHEVEGAVSGEDEGVARAGRIGEGVQGLGEGDVEALYAEETVEERQGPGHRDAVQQAVDGTDAEG